MKDYVFPYSARLGKLDFVDSEIAVSISNKDANRLESSAREGGKYDLLDEPELYCVFEKVYSAIMKREAAVLREDNELSRTEIEEYLDELSIKICFPKELQMLESTIKPKVRKAEIITTDRENAIELKKAKSQSVIYVDDGECLFYIPAKYAGKFTVKAGTKCFEKDVFKMHNRITEIELCEGVNEIPDWCFEQCENLEIINIPESVKGIGFNAFTECYALNRIEIAEGVEHIDNCAFRFCDNLKELIIPATVKEVSSWISSCMTNQMDKIYVNGMETIIIGDYRDNCTWYVHAGSEAEKCAVEKNIKHELF